MLHPTIGGEKWSRTPIHQEVMVPCVVRNGPNTYPNVDTYPPIYRPSRSVTVDIDGRCRITNGRIRSISTVDADSLTENYGRSSIVDWKSRQVCGRFHQRRLWKIVKNSVGISPEMGISCSKKKRRDWYIRCLVFYTGGAFGGKLWRPVRCPSSWDVYPFLTSVRISGPCPADKVCGVRGGSWHQQKRTYLYLLSSYKQERGTPFEQSTPTQTCLLSEI